MSDKVRQWTNLVAVLAMIAVNALANIIPFNNQTTAAVSDKFKVLFVPAGYVFAIWGVIYLGLVAFAVYQLLPAQAANPRLRRVGYLFAVSCIINAVWLIFWHYDFIGLSVVLMLALLVLLISIYLALRADGAAVSNAEKLLVRLPFSIYLGWITVATVANVTDFLWLIRWDGFGIGPEIWAVIMLIVGFALAAAMTFTWADVAYPLVIVWAFAGIAIKQAAVPTVSYAAWILAALTALVTVVALLTRRRAA